MKKKAFQKRPFDTCALRSDATGAAIVQHLCYDGAAAYVSASSSASTDASCEEPRPAHAPQTPGSVSRDHDKTAAVATALDTDAHFGVAQGSAAMSTPKVGAAAAAHDAL